jgi:hypothetical protein
LREVDYILEVVQPLVFKAGFQPGTNFTEELGNMYATFISLAVKKIHDRFDVPDWTLVEQRTPDANHYVAWEQPSQKIIHRALKLYLLDPRTTPPPVDYPFAIDVNGVHCGFEHGTNVWLRFMEPAPQYAGLGWLNDREYRKGDLAVGLELEPFTPPYSRGHTYKSLQNANTGHAVTDAAWWVKVPFPESVQDLVIRLAFAEVLREDGQFDKALSEENACVSEAATKFGAEIAPPFDTLSDQPRPAQRYRVPMPATPGGK